MVSMQNNIYENFKMKKWVTIATVIRHMEMDAYLEAPDSDDSREDEVNFNVEGFIQNAQREQATIKPVQAEFMEPNLEGADGAVHYSGWCGGC
jgi:hypothetical protein